MSSEECNSKPWNRSNLTIYEVYNVKSNKVVAEMTIHELGELLGIPEKSIRTIMSRDGFFRPRFYISKKEIQ